jgi:gliding motility-associated-like protein
MAKIKFYFMISILLICSNAYTQEQTNAGKDFWITSAVIPRSLDQEYYDYYNDSYPDSAIVYIVGNSTCNGYLENPQTGYHVDFGVVRDSVTEIKVPENQIMCNYSDTLQDKAIYIHTECDIYLFLQSNKGNADAPCDTPDTYTLSGFDCEQTNIISISPHTVFNHEVIAPEGDSKGIISVIATEDSTVITIWEDYEQGIAESFHNLQKGEIYTYWYFQAGQSYELSCPQKITSNCKKIIGYKTPVSYASVTGIKKYHHILQINHNQTSGRSFILPDALNLERSGHDSFGTSYADNSAIIYGDNPDFATGLYPCAFVNIPYYTSNFSQSVTDGGYILAEKAVYIIVSTLSFSGVTTFWPNYLPAERRVKEIVFPTRYDLPNQVDTLYSELTIIVSPEGIHSTYLNDELLPDTLFRTLPGIEDRFYYAQIAYWDQNIPELLKIKNSRGFTANLEQIGYAPYTYWDENYGYRQTRIYYYCSHLNSGGVASYLDEYDIPPVRCIGDTFLLYATNNYDHYATDWLINGTEYLNTDTVALFIQDSGQVDVRLIIHTDCPDTIYRTFQIEIPPIISHLASDTSLCSGESVSVISPNATQYLWSDGRQGATVPFTESGTYTVTASNSCYLQAVDSIHIFVYPPLTVNLGEDTALCSLISLLLDATNPHAVSYRWQDQSTNATYTVMYDGEYWVIVHDPCTGNSDTVNVLYLEPIALGLGNDTILCNGEELLLNASAPYCDYLWQDGSTDSLYRVYGSGEYSVTVSNLCFSDQDTITVGYESCDLTLYIPNSFTPDGDGINDRFQPQFNHPEMIKSYMLYIYDRWGGLQFRSHNLNNGWDAHNSSSGVYIYLIEYQGEPGGKKIAKGTVTVVRKK